MIKVSIFYPNRPGSRFNEDYYLSVHMPMAMRLLGSAVKDVSVEFGVSGATPNDPAPFAAIAAFTCESVEAFAAAFVPNTAALQGDIPNYTDIAPMIQIGKLAELAKP